MYVIINPQNNEKPLKMKDDTVIYEKFVGNYTVQPCLKSRKITRETVIYNKLHSKRKGNRYLDRQKFTQVKKPKPLKYYSVSVSTFYKYDDNYEKECERHEREINIVKDRIKKEKRRYKDTLQWYTERLEKQYRRHKIARNEFNTSNKKENTRTQKRRIEDEYNEYAMG